MTKDKKLPCVLDVKLGKGKIKADKVKSMTTESLKFRLCGMSVQAENSPSIFKDKYWGRNISSETIKQSLRLFFLNGCVYLI